MATYNKFNQFVEDLGLGVHNLNTGALKVYLTNAAPDAAADLIKTDLAEISTGNGYTGGVSVTPVWSETAGTATLSGTKVVITATGAVGPFRYVALFNDTPTSPVDPLIAWWDYGSAISLANGETFSIKFNNSDTTGSILTLS